MKFPLRAVLFFLGFGFSQICWGQTSGNANVAGAGGGEVALAVPASSYVVFGASPQQEALVRSQIQIMQPAVLPLRIVFVPHWKYIENTRIFQLHVPTGYTSALFTHLPSRTVFIDADRYIDESLGYWLAHELGHLATSSPREDDAEKTAHEYRKRLKQAHLETR
jgi:hypothetical protein